MSVERVACSGERYIVGGVSSLSQAIDELRTSGVDVRQFDAEWVSPYAVEVEITGMSDSVREAAARVRGRFDGSYAEGKHSMGNDINTVADAYLAEHLPDDEEAVTVNWVSSVSTGGKLTFYRDSKTWFACFSNSDMVLNTTKTRGQVRLLCKALGIELKEAK